MQYLGTDAGSSGPCWGKEKQTVSMKVPLMIGTKVSHNSGILVSVSNPVSSAEASGNDNMSPVLVD